MASPEGRVVVVTGGSGCIGSALLRRLVPRYPETHFINIDDLRAGSNADALATIDDADNYHFSKTPIEDVFKIRTLFSRIYAIYEKVDIIHLAAESDVDRSIMTVSNTTQTNVLGTINLLEEARRNRGRFHLVSTDEVYGPIAPDAPPSKETDPIRPSSPYSASKAAAEAYTMAYHVTYGVDTVITRCCNNFGPYQDYTKLIPVAMKSMRNREPVPLYGNGMQCREWIPVEDHVMAIEKVWLHGESGEVYNIGSGYRCTNFDLVKLLWNAVGRPSEKATKFVSDRPGHDTRYAVDSSKLKKLGWPDSRFGDTCHSVPSALELTAKWYFNIDK